MSLRERFSPARLMAMVAKEFVQMRRDRLTFAMMLGIPIMQLMLFGYAINMDPKGLPTALADYDRGAFARSFAAALQNSGYFTVTAWPRTEREAADLLARGDVQFVVTIPPDFSRDLVRGERPSLLVEADATDPAAASNAIGALATLQTSAFDHDLTGPLAAMRAEPGPIDLRVHRRYNPEGITQYNIVPGLMGVILTMTMVTMTALALTRERERGTMENLLAMPVRPGEVMLGKIIPYILVGYVQVALILMAARFMFGVPIIGDLWLLSVALLVYIFANLAVGFTFSALARNQMQAMQMSFFFFLPSLMLSGFMFPFRGMPDWAQTLGEIFPLTHFLRIVRGILLKGNGWAEIWPEIWPILLFLAAAMVVALRRYRQTLD